MLRLFADRMKLYSLFCLGMMAQPTIAQQQAQYGQYIFNGLYINPAYAGYQEATWVQASYRSQWTGIKGAPQSLSVALDASIPEKNIGLGAIISKDKIGAQSMINGYAIFAYRLRLSYDPAHTLSFGLGAGAVQNGIDGNLLEPGEQGDIKIPAGLVKRVVPDLRIGVQLTTNNFFIGFSVNNLFSRSIGEVSDAETYVTTQSHYYFTAAGSFPLYNDLKIKPSFLIKDDWHGPASLDLNAALIFKDSFSVGATYRSSLRIFPRETVQPGLTKRSAIGLNTDLLINKRLRVGYGFDYSLNRLASFDQGSHELSIAWYFSLARERSRLFFCF